MKNLFSGIWNAPASTVAAGLVASIGTIVATKAPVNPWVIVGLSAVSAFLALFSGKTK